MRKQNLLCDNYTTKQYLTWTGLCRIQGWFKILLRVWGLVGLKADRKIFFQISHCIYFINIAEKSGIHTASQVHS